jgi:hypothetical protein
VNATTFLEIVAYMAVIAIPPIVLGRFLAGPERASLAALFRFPTDEPWPRGVQEEEPPRWRPEAIHSSRSAGDRTATSAPTLRRQARLTRRTLTNRSIPTRPAANRTHAGRSAPAVRRSTISGRSMT